MARGNLTTTIEEATEVVPENDAGDRRLIGRIFGVINERASYGRRIGMSALGALAFAAAVPEVASAWHSDSRLNTIASWLAMRPVRALCYNATETKNDPNLDGGSGWTPSLQDGNTPWTPKDYTELPPATCNPLIRYFNGEYSSASYDMPLKTSKAIDEVYKLGQSVLTITHESYHLRRTVWGWNEGQVECHAIRHVPFVIKAMQMRPALAKAVYADALDYHKWVITNPGYNLKSCVVPSMAKVSSSFNDPEMPTVTRYEASSSITP